MGHERIFLDRGLFYGRNIHLTLRSEANMLLTINVPVVFMAWYVMVLRSATSLRGAFGRGEP